MCGRLVVYNPKTTGSLNLLGHEIPPNFNAAPTESLPIVRNNPQTGDKELLMARWGVMSAQPGRPYHIVRKDYLNPRNRFWPLKDNHCLVPAGGFYEWDENKAKGEAPYLIQHDPLEVFYIAGLCWQFENQGEINYGFSIFTTEPHDVVKKIQHRSPVVINESKQQQWLSSNFESSQHLIGVYQGRFSKYKVDPKVVNNAHNKAVDCIKPLG